LFSQHIEKKKGVPSAVGFPHCAGSGEGLSLSPKPYPHKCAEAGARTRDLPVTDGRLYRCTRPALLDIEFDKEAILSTLASDDFRSVFNLFKLQCAAGEV